MDLERTLEIYDFILNEYKKLSEDGILVLDYTGYARDYRLYHLLDWYISYKNGQSKLNFDNRYFDYQKLIELLDNSGMDYINNHISTETIGEQFKNSASLFASFNRDFETVSRIYVADNVSEKIKVRKLNNE
jgi:hypothetical protein